MKKLTSRFLLCVSITVLLLGLTGVLEWRYCGLISMGAVLAIHPLDEKNRGEWRFLSVEEAQVRLSKKPRILRYLRRDPPSEMPPAAWQAMRTPAWPTYAALIAPAPVVGLLILATIKIKNAAGGVSTVVSTALGAVWFVVLFAFVVLLSVPTKRRRRLCDRAASADHELCLECGYVLRGLPEIHQCPECGAKYDKANVQSVWKQWCAD